MNALVKLGVATVALMALAAAAAVWVLPPSPSDEAARRQQDAERLVDRLTQEIWNYYHDHGDFPPGDGQGSASLVEALRRRGRDGRPYMMFAREEMTELGDLRNPVSPRTSIIYYRNNRVLRVEGVHNGMTFDLWGRSADGRSDGVNNWD